MQFYPYEYFCGANVVVELNGVPAHEIAGISYGIQESKLPLYGYSSVHFDAVARGQVLVQGSLIINYIHQDYLLRTLEVGKEYRRSVRADGRIPVPSNIVADTSNDFFDALREESQAQAVIDQVMTDPSGHGPAMSAFQHKYWGANSQLPERDAFMHGAFEMPIPITPGHSPAGVYAVSENVNPTAVSPHDRHAAVDIKITFGERNPFNPNGTTGVLISGVYFIGRGVPIRIDEEVIVEEYSFIARNIHSLNTEALAVNSDQFTDDIPGDGLSLRSKPLSKEHLFSADQWNPISYKSRW